MKKIEIPVPAVIISALVGLSLGIAFEYVNRGILFPRILLIFFVSAVSAGALLQLIFWLVARRRKVLLPLNLENLTCQIVEFLHLVIKNMHYRRAARQEVMTELAAHFEDELKDCKTEQEKEQKAKQLIEQFGDPKLLGILLRRAKKRCRPFWRTAVVRSFQAAGILILCLIAYIVWFMIGKPVITTDYVAELNRLVRPAADESQNAYPLYDKAFQLLKANSDYNEVKELLGKKYDEATADEKGKIEKWLITNKEVFELVIAGCQKPYYWRVYKNKDPNSGMMGVFFPELSGFRHLARFLSWRARLSAEQGHYEDSFNDLTACYRFGRHIRQGSKTLIEQLVGIAIEAISVGTTRDILGEHKIDSSALKALQENLEQAFANENFVINFTSDKLFIYDEIQRCFTDGAFGSHLYLPHFMGLSTGISGSETKPDFAMVFHVLFTHPGKRESRQQAERLYDYWNNIAHKTPAQIHSEMIDDGKEFMKIVKGNLLLEMLAPAVGRVVETGYRIKTDIQATVAIIALQRYEQDKGQYPDSLNDLIAAGYLKELPIDPWSDKPLIYRKTESSFTLYSVGLNLKDDGGIPAKSPDGKIMLWDYNKREGDAVFWPAAK
jgi:hypothetical protein